MTIICHTDTGTKFLSVLPVTFSTCPFPGRENICSSRDQTTNFITSSLYCHSSQTIVCIVSSSVENSYRSSQSLNGKLTSISEQEASSLHASIQCHVSKTIHHIIESLYRMNHNIRCSTDSSNELIHGMSKFDIALVEKIFQFRNHRLIPISTNLIAH